MGQALSRAGVPGAVLDARTGLHEADRQEAEEDHQGQAEVVHPVAEGEPPPVFQRWWTVRPLGQKSISPMPSMP